MEYITDDESQIFFEELKNEMEYETIDIHTPYKSVQVWSNNETKQLMDLYRRLIRDVGPQKRFPLKKEMWSEIATHFPTKDLKQCEQRYNTVLKRKKKGLTKVYISEARRKTIDCAENTLKINRIHKKEKRRDKIISTNHIQNIMPVKNTANITTTTDAENKSLTIQNTLLQISTKKEEAKEKRHREKMEAIEKIQNLLEQILDSKNK